MRAAGAATRKNGSAQARGPSFGCSATNSGGVAASAKVDTDHQRELFDPDRLVDERRDAGEEKQDLCRRRAIVDIVRGHATQYYTIHRAAGCRLGLQFTA